MEITNEGRASAWEMEQEQAAEALADFVHRLDWGPFADLMAGALSDRHVLPDMMTDHFPHGFTLSDYGPAEFRALRGRNPDARADATRV